MPLQARWVVDLVCLLVIGLVANDAAAQQESADLVTIEAGGLPIILSAPHGGREAIPGVPKRQGEGVDRFIASSDSNTDQLAEQLAAALEKKLGKRPYTVIARFHRKYADANRPRELAYESDNAKATYDAYHQALAVARQEVIDRWGHGILLDIHGQGADAKAIFRGTQNGKTTTHLVSRFGLAALTGKTSLFGQLAEQGFPVIPAVGANDRENPKYNGGYTVSTYGSGLGGTVDALQLELGMDLRSSQAIATTASKLATAITAFADDYLPKTKKNAEESDTGKQPIKKVRVGVYCDKGAGKSRNNLMNALQSFDEVTVQELLADDIRSGALADLDVLIQPGGSGGEQGRNLGEEGREKIREFIRGGKGYIGICAGAYLASADYEWSLNVLDAKVLDRKHWARGNGTVEIELTDVGKRVLRTEVPKLQIHYGQGPLLAPAHKSDIADYETLATYATEIAKNGAPTGVMKGTTAVAQGEFGRGRVLCFSPHPEATQGLEVLLHYAIDNVTQQRLHQKP